MYTAGNNRLINLWYWVKVMLIMGVGVSGNQGSLVSLQTIVGVTEKYADQRAHLIGGFSWV